MNKFKDDIKNWQLFDDLIKKIFIAIKDTKIVPREIVFYSINVLTLMITD